MYCRSALTLILGTALLLFVLPAVGLAEDPPPAIKFLDDAPAQDGSKTYVVTPGSELVLPFAVSEALKEKKLELYLSPLRGTQGDTEALAFSIDGFAAAAKNQRLEFTASGGPLFNLRLKVPELANPGEYSGTVGILEDGKFTLIKSLVLKRPPVLRNAELVVERKSQTAYARTLSFCEESGSFALQMRNPSADWPAEGVFFRVIEATNPAGTNFDPERNLQLTWNGSAANDLWHSPAAGNQRSLAPKQEVLIRVEPRDLGPGEYSVKLGLGASNLTIDDQNPITLKLFVRHGVLTPLIILLLAGFLSWFATKGLESQRKRANQLLKISEIRKGGWRLEGDSLPNVAVRAFLKQAEDRNRNWYDALFGPDSTTAQIARAELLARILERVAKLKERIGCSDWTHLCVHRASKRLSDILGSMDPTTIDANTATLIEGKLADLEKWFDPKEHDALYMADWERDLKSLINFAKATEFDPQYSKIIDDLQADISQANDLKKLERAYAILKILWRRRDVRDNEALQRLLGLLRAKPQIAMEDFFREADRDAWSKLVQAEFEFVKPDARELEPRRAYELIKFEIQPKVSDLGKNFSFEHKATYVWTLWNQKGDQTTFDRESATKVTTERTNEPRIVQYAPQKGRYFMTVSLEYEGRPVEKPPCPFGPFRIEKSSEFGARSIFRFTETAAFGIATIFAVISGLATFYFGKPAFGSATDYVSLFLWGAGVDQTKNFLQQLEKKPDQG